jgi:hypothetical protein
MIESGRVNPTTWRTNLVATGDMKMKENHDVRGAFEVAGGEARAGWLARALARMPLAMPVEVGPDWWWRW